MNYEKFRNFLNDDDNAPIVRLGMVLMGLIFGTFFILLSTLFEANAPNVAFRVFGYATFFSLLVGSGIWYLIDNT